MICIENVEVLGWEHAIRGMRNPMNSWEKSDTKWWSIGVPGTNPAALNDKYLREKYCIGPNDLDLMKRLRNAGTDHRKFMRMITVYVDITAPLYWWKEFDTYKVATVVNSCSTMHKIHAKEFTLEDFSCEHMYQETYDLFRLMVDHLNKVRDVYLNGGVLRVGEAPAWFDPKDKEIWWNLIQLLPSSYNQKRTVMMNYEVLTNIYKSRKNHKLDEWAEHKESEENKELAKNFASGKWGFCDWIKTLPYAFLITGEETE